MDPTYPLEELGGQGKALEGKEKQEGSKRIKITIFGKKAFGGILKIQIFIHFG